jgi:hypothetical protein
MIGGTRNPLCDNNHAADGLRSTQVSVALRELIVLAMESR